MDLSHINFYTKAEEISNGKDTLTGHLEMMGVITNKPFKTFLNGFPKELIDEIEELSGRKVIGNCVASGTEIIKELYFRLDYLIHPYQEDMILR